MRLLGPAPSPGPTAFASSRTRLWRGSTLRMTSRKKMVPQRNGIAATRRKGAYPLGRSRATQTTWEDAMSAIPSGSSAGRTNTLRQERIEVRRSSLALQTDYTVGNRSVTGKRSSRSWFFAGTRPGSSVTPFQAAPCSCIAPPSTSAKNTQPGR